MEKQVTVFNHPLIQHKLTFMRDKNTGSKLFRELVGEVAMLMCYEATRDLDLEEIEIETPVAPCKANIIAGRKLAFVPILRAGCGMLDAMLQMVPAAKVGHIGLYRDPQTHQPVEYYNKLPADIHERDVFVLDPMLATAARRWTQFPSSRKATQRALNSYVSSRRPRESRRLRRRIQTCRCFVPRRTTISTSMLTSFPDWATRATGYLEQSKSA